MNAKVSNMVNNRGNIIPNQFIITTDNGQYFQSYDSIIVFRDKENNITLDENYWDYSVTTGKYRNIFLNESKPETQAKIKSGEYALTDLNGGK